MDKPKGKAEVKSFGKPEEVRQFPKGKVELVIFNTKYPGS